MILQSLLAWLELTLGVPQLIWHPSQVAPLDIFVCCGSRSSVLQICMYIQAECWVGTPPESARSVSFRGVFLGVVSCSAFILAQLASDTRCTSVKLFLVKISATVRFIAGINIISKAVKEHHCRTVYHDLMMASKP